MAFMFQIKIFQNYIDEGGRSSLSVMPLFLEAKWPLYPPSESSGTTKTTYSAHVAKMHAKCRVVGRSVPMT